MAFGDVFAGWQQAATQHYHNLLQMDYEQKNKMADEYAKLAQDTNFRPEQRAEFANRAFKIHTLKPMEKPPKEWANRTIQIQPPAPAPVNIPGSAGSNAQSISTPEGEVPQYAQAAIEPRTIQPPAPPAQSMDLFQQYGPQELAEMAARAKMAGITDIGNYLQSHGVPAQAAAVVAAGHPLPGLANVPGELDAKEVQAALGNVDSAGEPIDLTAPYRGLRDAFGNITQAYKAIPQAARQSARGLTPDLATRLQQQGQPLNDRSGKAIDVSQLGPQDELVPVIGQGIKPGTYDVVSQPISTFTAGNIVQTRGRYGTTPLTQLGPAQVPRAGTTPQPFQDVNTGQTVYLPVPGRNVTPLTGGALPPAMQPGPPPNATGQTGISEQQPVYPPNPAYNLPGMPQPMAPAPPTPATQPKGKGAKAQSTPPLSTTGATTPQTPATPTPKGGFTLPPNLMPAGVEQQQRNLVIPIQNAATQILGDPKNPGFKSLMSFAHFADDRDASERIGKAARFILQDMEEAERNSEGFSAHVLGQGASVNGGDLWGALKNRWGITKWISGQQVQATNDVLDDLALHHPDEYEALNRIISSYGDVSGLRSATRGAAQKFSIKNLENELPIPGISVSNSHAYYDKISAIAELINNTTRNKGISPALLPEKDYYEAITHRLSSQKPVLELKGKRYYMQPDGTYQ